MMSVQGICDTQVSSYHAAREASTRPSQLIILFPNATIKRERFRGIMLKVFCVKAIFPRLLVRSRGSYCKHCYHCSHFITVSWKYRLTICIRSCMVYYSSQVIFYYSFSTSRLSNSEIHP